MSDFIIVDDVPLVRETVKMHVMLQDGFEAVNPILFEKSSLALEYILRSKMPVAGYLCDMRIPDELEGPRQLYEALRACGRAENFYFMTGNFSDHDRKVVGQTGARYTLKEDVPAVLEQIAAQYTPKKPPATSTTPMRVKSYAAAAATP